MIDLSIVIVNYNVKFFLAQCIASLYESSDTLKKEIIVVDNASQDGSVEFIKRLYPTIISIENKENLGFSKANNQAFNICNGKYILVLNPDTIVSKDTIQLCYNFLKEHSEYGAVGVKMVDGKGNYLPESKRGFPNVGSSFFRFANLDKIFPKSVFFNHYYLGNLSENEDQDIEVLTGAFLFTSKSIIKELKGFDEDFFMYGEDIDLSKRIFEQGAKIRFLASTSIIHFKGESTKRNSLQYIKRFYGAMKIYADKHTSSTSLPLVKVMLTLSIIFLAFYNGVKLFLKNSFELIVAFLMTFLSFVLTKSLWARYYFGNSSYFDDQIYVNLIGYSVITVLCIWFMGWFDKVFKAKYLIVGTVLALFILLSIYAILPEHLRYSRAVIFIGLFFSSIFYWIYKFFKNSWFNKKKSMLFVSNMINKPKLTSIIDKRIKNYTILGFVHPTEGNTDIKYLENIDQLNRIVTDHQPDYIVFDVKAIGMNKLSKYMTTPGSQVKYLLASIDESTFIETSTSKEKSEIWEIDPLYNLAKPLYRRMKRTLDFLVGLLMLVSTPIFIFLRDHWFNHSKQLILGQKTIVGYSQYQINLPILPSGIYTSKSLIGQVVGDEIVDSELKSDLCYAKYYHPWIDVNLIIRSFIK